MFKSCVSVLNFNAALFGALSLFVLALRVVIVVPLYIAGIGGRIDENAFAYGILACLAFAAFNKSIEIMLRFVENEAAYQHYQKDARWRQADLSTSTAPILTAQPKPIPVGAKWYAVHHHSGLANGSHPVHHCAHRHFPR